MSSWLNTTLNKVFSWFKPKESTGNPTKQTKRRPRTIDETESLPVNSALTKGLYHNEYPGLKLAGAMAFTPIAVPIWFMGVPIPVSDDKATQEELNIITEMFYRQTSEIHLMCHREGTIWVFPKYSAKKGRLIWEFIDDESVVDIVKDIETGEPVEIITDEMITIVTGENKTATVRRKKYYTKEKITIKWLNSTSVVPAELKDVIYRNPIGILPLPCSNNADGNEVRGHSDYGRIVSDLKDYHDIDLKQSTFLSKFEPKLKLNVLNVDDWLVNNGEEAGSLSTLEIFKRDILFCVEREDAGYIYPDRAYQAYESALKRKFRKLVEGSGIPEMLWGTKVEGNHASAQEQMNNVVKFVEEKRTQKNKFYTDLFNASLSLLNISHGGRAIEKRVDSIAWNRLDALSDDMKAKIIKDFASGIAILIDKAGMTKDMTHKLWKEMFPGVAPEEFEDFKTGLSDMAKHRQFVNTDYAIAADMTGDELLDDEG